MFKPLNLKNLTIATPIFAAPMAGITDWPTRQILRKCAPDAPIVTEMISSHSLVEKNVGANNHLPLRTNKNRNFDDYRAEKLIGAQIFGADPKIMAEAAKILEQNGAAWIDVNMGCPVPKVATRAGAGAFLMRDHALAGRIVAAVAAAVKIPVSMKTRIGWDAVHLDSAELVRIARDAGAQFAAIHGRTRAAGYAGAADWNTIAKIKQQLNNFPIIFNGDIKTAADISAVECLGADGAMLGRALLGNPWLLGELTNSYHVSRITYHDLILEHFHLTLEYYGERAGVPLFRKHLAWYSAGMKNSAGFRVAVNRISVAVDMEKAIREFFGCEPEI